MADSALWSSARSVGMMLTMAMSGDPMSESEKAEDCLSDDQAAARLAAHLLREHPDQPPRMTSRLMDHLADEMDDLRALREGKG